jgi:hypothetical protein
MEESVVPHAFFRAMAAQTTSTENALFAGYSALCGKPFDEIVIMIMSINMSE